MSHLPTLITDLTLILAVAAITSLLFKRLKQPVVLGYLVAGFLVGPHFGFFPQVADVANVNIWAEIGIIILLFSLGLEFSFRRLVTVGGTAVIAALTIVIGMMMAGYFTGRLLNFTSLDSLFLGAMLSMSSTTIIIKAFTDLHLRKQKFTGLVFGVLVVEDLFAVLMMVLLTSIAVNKQFEGEELIAGAAKLFFFLVLWFLVGTFLIPTFLNKIRRFLNAETLLIVSVGLCLSMVVLATYVGFSSALGAFVMGSILAGTHQAEQIEKVIRPVGDLFGAVFFVSVGMLVVPATLVTYALPILIISGVVIVGQIFFSTSGLLIAGQPLQIAIRSSFSLAQIGEFAFIIATLGMSLGVIESYLYPIVVAVSVITTFTTPFFIGQADHFYHWIEGVLPHRWLVKLNRYSQETAHSVGSTTQSLHAALSIYAGKLLLYITPIVGILLLTFNYLLPLAVSLLPGWGKALALCLSFATLMPFLWGLGFKTFRSERLDRLWLDNTVSHVPLILVYLFRIIFSISFSVYFFYEAFHSVGGVLLGIIAYLLSMSLFSVKFKDRFMRMERRLVNNLNERELRRTGRNNAIVHNIHLATMEVHTNCPFIGRRLVDANFYTAYGINVVSIKRGATRINIPKGTTRLFPGDVISVVGSDENIHKFLHLIEQEDTAEVLPNKQERISLEKIEVKPDSPLINTSIAESGLRDRAASLVIGIDRDNGEFLVAQASLVFRQGDVVWLAGEKSKIDAYFS